MVLSVLQPGLDIDGFHLVRRLHRGGMADIWEVTRPDIDFPIVMKVPLLDFESDLSMVVGFEVEHMILAEVSGPHVPKLVARGTFRVQPYVVIERLEGETLDARRVAAPLPIAEVLDLGRGFADALADLHRQHVLHLDLKPGNAFRRPDGTVVLIDFGLSRSLELPDLIHEEFHAATGTPDYMAPEQALCIRTELRSDIYAVGAMLYEFATGELPFGPTVRTATVKDRLWRRPRPPRLIRPEITPGLQEIILRCLEPDPKDRYRTAGDLATALAVPERVPLTARAKRLDDTFRARWSRWWRAGRLARRIRTDADGGPPPPPMIVVGVDFRPGLEALQEAVRSAAAEYVAEHPEARLACVNILQTSLLSIDRNVDQHGENIHVARLGALQEWAEPLARPPHLLTCHVVEALSPGGGLIDFARANHADRLIVGAPVGRTGLGEVTSFVRAEAPCPVTIVRLEPHAPAPASAAADA